MKKWKLKKKYILTCIFICMIVLVGVLSFNNEKIFSSKIKNDKKQAPSTNTNAYINRSRQYNGDRFQLIADTTPHDADITEAEIEKIAATGFTTAIQASGLADISATSSMLKLYNKNYMDVFSANAGSINAFDRIELKDSTFNTYMTQLNTLIKENPNMTGIWAFDEGFSGSTAGAGNSTGVYATSTLQQHARDFSTYINKIHAQTPVIFNNFPSYAEALNPGTTIWSPDSYDTYLNKFLTDGSDYGARYLGIDYYNDGLSSNFYNNSTGHWYYNYLNDLIRLRNFYVTRRSQKVYTIPQAIVLISPREGYTVYHNDGTIEWAHPELKSFQNVNEKTIAFQINTSLQFGMKSIGYFSYCSGDGHIGISNCAWDLTRYPSDTTLYNAVKNINKWAYNLGSEMYKRDLKGAFILTKSSDKNTASVVSQVYNDNSCKDIVSTYVGYSSAESCDTKLFLTFFGDISSQNGDATLTYLDDGSIFITNPNIDTDAEITVNFINSTAAKIGTNVEYYDPSTNNWYLTGSNSSILSGNAYTSTSNGYNAVKIKAGYGIWLRRNDYTENVRSDMYIVNNSRKNVMVYANLASAVTGGLSTNYTYEVTNTSGTDKYLTDNSTLKVKKSGNVTQVYSLSGIYSDSYYITPSFIYTGNEFVSSKIKKLGNTQIRYDYNATYTSQPMNIYLVDKDAMKRLPIVTFKSSKYTLNTSTKELNTNGETYSEDAFKLINGYVIKNGNTLNFYLEGTTTLIDTVTLVTQAPLSSENRLSSLSISNPSSLSLTTTFNRDNTGPYATPDVPNSISSVTFSATPVDSNANVTGKTCSLTAGTTTMCKITVTAQNGDINVYKVNIKRAAAATVSSEARLSNLSITSPTGYSLSPAFDKDRNGSSYPYSVSNLDYNLATMKFSATPMDSNASVTGTTCSLSYTTSVQQCIITVTAQDQTQVKYYVNVKKNAQNLSDEARLSNLKVTSPSGYTLSPTFDPDRFGSSSSYTVYDLPYETEYVRFSATPMSSNAEVSGNLTCDTSSPGVQKQCIIYVTAPSGNQIKYYVNIKRKTTPSYDTYDYLRSLTIKCGNDVNKSFAVSDNDLSYYFDVPDSQINKTCTANYTTHYVSSTQSHTFTIRNTNNQNQGYTEFVVTNPNNGNNVHYTLVYKIKSTDNDLKSLTIDNNNVSANSTNTYTYTVLPTTSKVNITTTKADKATYTYPSGYTGSIALNLTGTTTTQTIKIRSEWGVEKTYTINVIRPMDDAVLENLQVVCSAASFSSNVSLSNGTYQYSMDVPDTLIGKTVIVRYRAGYSNGYTEVNKTMGSGTTTISFVVKPSDGNTTYQHEYTLTLNPKSTDNALKSLTIANQNINISGSQPYTITVPYETTSVAVRATKASTASFTAGVGSDGTATWDNLTVGDNNKTITIKSQYGPSIDYRVKVVREKSKNANLSNLTVSSGELDKTFNKNTTEYSITVEYEVTSVTLTGIKEFDNSTVTKTCSNLSELQVNNCDLVVTAPYGNTKMYRVVITRKKSGDKTLKSLGLEGFNLDSPLTAGVTEYDVTVPYTTESVKVVAQANINVATLTYQTEDHTIALPKEITTYKITVRAQNGDEQEYTLNIKRVKNKDATLKTLSIVGYNFTEPFEKDKTDYTVVIPYRITTVTVRGETSYEYATILTGTGIATIDKTNPIIIKVRAEDPTESKEYRINVTRAKSSEVSLSSLSVEGYTVSPKFTSSNDTYSVNVPNGTTSVTVNATTKDQYAKVVSGIGKVNVVGDETPVEVKVRAEDGLTEKTYTITINQARSDNANITNVKVPVGVLLSPTFDPNVKTYTVYTEGNSVKLDYVGEASGEDKTVTFELPEGTNTKTFTVEHTAPNGTTKNTYTFNVNKVEKTPFDEVGALNINSNMSENVFNEIFKDKADNLVLENFEVEDKNILEIVDNKIIPKQPGTTRLIYDKYAIEVNVPEVKQDRSKTDYKVVDKIKITDLLSTVKTQILKSNLSNSGLNDKPMFIENTSSYTVGDIEVIVENDNILTVDGEYLVVATEGTTNVVLGSEGNYYEVNIKAEFTPPPKTDDDSDEVDKDKANQNIENPKTGIFDSFGLILISILLLAGTALVVLKKKSVFRRF